MISFGFFYNMSLSLANLLERIELFTVSSEIREQLSSRRGFRTSAMEHVSTSKIRER